MGVDLDFTVRERAGIGSAMRAAYVLSTLAAALMAIGSAAGLLIPHLYPRLPVGLGRAARRRPGDPRDRDTAAGGRAGTRGTRR